MTQQKATCCGVGPGGEAYNLKFTLGWNFCT